jgi:phospholipid transport system substrate-binding protein
MGKHWRSATDDQRQRLTGEFRTLLIRSYVSAMVTYVDQILQHADSVQFPPERSRQEGDTAVVTMLISLESGKQVAVQYQMYRSDGEWKIYDVQIEGISLALTYRSTFSQEIAQAGVEGLIASLAERNRQAGPEPLPGVSQNGGSAH